MRTDPADTQPSPLPHRDPPPRHRPAAAAAVAIIIGIAVAHEFAPSGWVLLAAGFGAAALGVVVMRRRPGSRRAFWMVLALVALVGAARYRLAVTPLDPAHLGRFATADPALVRLTGTVVGQPHIRDPERSRDTFRPVLGPATIFTLSADGLEHGTQSRRAAGRVLVICHEAAPDVGAGDRVAIVGRLTKPVGPSNPGRPTRPREALAAVLTTDHARAITPLERRTRRLGLRIVGALRRHMADTIRRHLNDDHAAMMLALLIGDRDRIEGDLKRSFQVTGTAHLMAISGLHVGLVAAMTWGLARLVRIPERIAYMLVVAVAVLYALVTGLHAPALRACAMIAVLALGALARREGDLINSLGLAAAAVLLVDPLDLFRAGFQLSFVATLGLMLFVDPVEDGLRRIGARVWRKRLDRRKIAAAAGRRHRSLPPRYSRAMRQVVAVCLVAWLVTMPLTAYYFRFVAWLCPLATLVAWPFLWLSLAGGVAMCVAEAVGLGAWAAPVARVGLDCLAGVLRFFASVPGSDVFSSLLPTLGTVLLCYAGLAVLALRRRWGVSARRLGLALAVIAGGVVWSVLADNPAPADPELTVLEVGHGQCAVLRTPEGRTVLLDAGSLTRAGGAWRTVENALIALRVRRIDLIALSHTDRDHYSALPGLLGAFPVGAVALPDRFLTSDDQDVHRLMDLLKARRVPLRVVRAGDSITDFDPLVLDVLNPGPDADDLSDNNASVVVRARYGSRAVLATGDLQEVGIDALLSRGADVTADVLLAPHHGRFEANLHALVQAVGPRVAIASGPRVARVEQAMPVFRAGGAAAFVTGSDGAVTVTLSPDALRIRTWRAPVRRTTVPLLEAQDKGVRNRRGS